jgi:thiol-disulfide isomerase/thioredoxin
VVEEVADGVDLERGGEDLGRGRTLRPEPGLTGRELAVDLLDRRGQRQWQGWLLTFASGSTMRTMARLLVPLCWFLVLLPACTGGGSGDPPPPSGSPAVNAAQAALLPATVDALPDLDAAGFRTLLSQLKGTPVVVNIWAAWCDPCMVEAPELAKAAASTGTKIQFLGVDVRDNREDGRRFVEHYALPYPSVFDVDGAILTQAGFTGPPVTLFYDADGALVDTAPGQISPERLAEGIAKLQ